MKKTIGILLLLLIGTLYGQQTSFYQNPQKAYRKAIDLFERGHFNAAKDIFEKLAETYDDYDLQYQSEAQYHAALCDLRLFHKSAGSRMEKFIEKHPLSYHKPAAYFELGSYYYTLKEFSKAAIYYTMVDPESFQEPMFSEFVFRRSYALFHQKKYAEAKIGFYDIKEGNSKYKNIASYYYGYILYTEENYQTALNEFASLTEDPNFGAIVPFYILQIYYMQENYDKVIEQAVPLFELASDKRAMEISRLLGEAYFYKAKYNEALPYLKRYNSQAATTPTYADNYILGYTYYKLEKIDSAILYLSSAVSDPDKHLLTQSALYHLGACYVLVDQKNFAMRAFGDAAKINGRPKLKEESMYNYIKLAYELSIAPFTDAITAMNTYLNDYPNSPYKNEINSYMVEMFFSTKNYTEAMTALQKINRKSPELLLAHQKIAFNRGMESYYQTHYKEAITWFDTAIYHHIKEEIALDAYFWKGEALCKMNQFEAAEDAYRIYAEKAKKYACKDAHMVDYALGYAYFQGQKYEKALQSFQRFLKQSLKEEERSKIQDAFVRSGDAAFMIKQYAQAISYYDSARAKDPMQPDYILFQKALAYGALGKYDKKIELLNTFLDSYPVSLRIPAVINDLALTYLIMENDTKALLFYAELSKRYPKTVYSRNAALKQGLIYFNRGDSQKALAYFERLIEESPNSSEAKQALVSIRNIYMSLNQMEEFFAFAKKIPNMKIEESEQDSLMYTASQTKYLEGDCASARNGLEQYVKRFPQGFFLLEAHYYIAECAMKAKEWNIARQNYEKVVALPSSLFTEKALIQVSKLCFDNKDYKAAVGYYQRLLNSTGSAEIKNNALLGQMRSFVKLSDPAKQIQVAQELLKMPLIKIEMEEEARFTIAKAAKYLGDKSLARKEYKNLSSSKNPEYYAESKYFMMEDAFEDGRLTDAEKMIFDFISEAPYNEYYLAKSYILWADIYEQRGNILQAKQTLQSIIDQYEGEDLVRIAESKKQAIINKEEALRQADSLQRMQMYPEESEIVIPEM